MTKNEALLNEFLVDVFNDILRLEETNINKSGYSNISVSEMHVLEVIARLGSEAPCGMAEVAQALGVTAGTLTIAVKTLEQKGFVRRERGEKDKRRVQLTLCEGAKDALRAHEQFHEKLVANAAATLSEGEMCALTQALGSLHMFFKGL
ncbi:MAG: MarR family transcriptional regulator [Oscillospiraceae bacterium]